MKFIKKIMTNKNFILPVTGLTILVIIQLLVGIYDNAKNINNYKAWMCKDIDSLLRVSIENKLEVTSFIYHEFIDEEIAFQLSEVIDHEAVKDQIRSDLLTEFSPIYEHVQGMGINYVHFQLPNTESFLRLHAPEVYGDRLIAMRQTVNAAIREKKVVTGFEEGRLTNGYRYVYPIFYGDDLVGTVEFSFSLYSVVIPILHTYDMEGALVMKRHDGDSENFAKEHKNYVPDDLFGMGYLDSDFKCDDMAQRLGISNSGYMELNGLMKAAMQSGYYGESGFRYVVEDDHLFWAVPVEAKDYTGKTMGVFVFYKKDATLYDLYCHQKHQKQYMYITSGIVLLLIAFAVYCYTRMRYKATNDSLTHLFNRHYYTEYVVQRGLTGSVMMIDIDDFKRVNDDYGHSVGDLILKHIADILKQNIRSTDCAIRWGGEEFLVVLKDADVNIACKKGEYLLELIRALRVDGIGVTVSIGVSCLDGEHDQSIVNADQALYYVKTHGKNAVQVYENIE
ncbi:MAG: diguanylate cyclase [Clostridia bacterium]|nr:diguanylate cyclase [Clostridia bacterium]